MKIFTPLFLLKNNSWLAGRLLQSLLTKFAVLDAKPFEHAFHCFKKNTPCGVGRLHLLTSDYIRNDNQESQLALLGARQPRRGAEDETLIY